MGYNDLDGYDEAVEKHTKDLVGQARQLSEDVKRLREHVGYLDSQIKGVKPNSELKAILQRRRNQYVQCWRELVCLIDTKTEDLRNINSNRGVYSELAA